MGKRDDEINGKLIEIEMILRWPSENTKDSQEHIIISKKPDRT